MCPKVLRRAAEQGGQDAGALPGHGVGSPGMVAAGGGPGALGAASWAGLQNPALAFGGSLGQGGRMGAGSGVLPGMGGEPGAGGPFLGFPGLTHPNLAALGGGASGLPQSLLQPYTDVGDLADAQARAAALAGSRAEMAGNGDAPGGSKHPARRAFISLEVDEAKSLGQTPPPRLRWTPQLHRRFKEAVEHLGGATNATPKAIVAAMQVKDLTVYHVKSHLQKYRTSEAEVRKGPKGKTGGKSGGAGGNGDKGGAGPGDGPSTSKGGANSAEKPDSVANCRADWGGDLAKVFKELEDLKGELKVQTEKAEKAHATSVSTSRALERIQRECLERGWDLSSPPGGGGGSAGGSTEKAGVPQPGSPQLPLGPAADAPEGPAGEAAPDGPAAPEAPEEDAAGPDA